MADATVVIDANASGLDSAMREATAAARSFGRGLDEVKSKARKAGRETQKTTSKLDSFAEEAERMNRVSMILGGTFGDLTGGLDDFAVLLQSGAGKLTLFGAAAVIAGAGVLALGAGVISTLANTRELTDELSGRTQKAFADQITAAQDADDALANLGTEASATALIWSSELAPAITTGADALSTVLRAFQLLSPALGVYKNLLVDTFGNQSILNRVILEGVDALASYTDGLDDVEKAEARNKAARLAEEQEFQKALVKFVRERRQAEIDEAEEFFDDLIALETDRIARERKAAEAAADEAVKIRSDRSKRLLVELQAGLRHEIEAEDKAAKDRDRKRKEREAEAQADLERRAQERIDSEKRTQAAIADAVGAASEASVRNLEQLHEKRVQRERDAATTITGIVGLAASIQTAIIEGAADAGGRAQRKAAKAALAVQLVQAIAATALAAIQAFASGGNPVVGAILMGLALAAGGVQIGVISNQIGKLHTGGLMAPDETLGPQGATITRDERTAVLTPQALRSIGGEAGVSRLNTVSGSSASPTINLFIGDRRIGPARPFAGVDPGYGQAR